MGEEANFLIRVLETQGFAIVFGVSVLYFIGKNAPRFLAAWTGFTKAISENTLAMTSLVGECSRSVEQSRSVLEEMKDLKKRLDDHDANADEVRENQGEMLALLREIHKSLLQVKNKTKGAS